MPDPRTVTVPRALGMLVLVAGIAFLLARCTVTDASSVTEPAPKVTSTVTLTPVAPSATTVTETITLNTAYCDGQG